MVVSSPVGEAADRAVVGVGDRDRSVGEHGDAERVLEERVGGRAVAEAEVEEAGADGGVDLDRPRRSAATRSPSRPARAGRRRRRGRWSGRTTRRRAVRRAALRSPYRPRPRRRPVSGSKVQSWCTPAIAIHTRSCHHATSHGLLSRDVPSPSNHCWPSPASVVTATGREGQPGQPVADGVGHDHVVVEAERRRERGRARWARGSRRTVCSTSPVGRQQHHRVVAGVGDQHPAVGQRDRLGREAEVRRLDDRAGRRASRRAGACPSSGAPRSASRAARRSRARGPRRRSARRRSPPGR